MITKMTLRLALTVTLLGGSLFADVAPVGAPGPFPPPPGWLQFWNATNATPFAKIVANNLPGGVTFLTGFQVPPPAGWGVSAFSASSVTLSGTPATTSLNFALAYSADHLTTSFSHNITLYTAANSVIDTYYVSWHSAGQNWTVPESSTAALRAGWLAGLGFLLIRRRKLHVAA